MAMKRISLHFKIGKLGTDPNFRFLTADHVISIHEGVIQPNELQGMARNKSIEAVLGRIENRLAYGLIGDAFDLAASYACYIAVGHCFHDANKRTAHTSMQLVLALNGISIEIRPLDP